MNVVMVFFSAQLVCDNYNNVKLLTNSTYKEVNIKTKL